MRGISAPPFWVNRIEGSMVSGLSLGSHGINGNTAAETPQ